MMFGGVSFSPSSSYQYLSCVLVCLGCLLSSSPSSLTSAQPPLAPDYQPEVSLYADPFGIYAPTAWNAQNTAVLNLLAASRYTLNRNANAPYLRASFDNITGNYDLTAKWYINKADWNDYKVYTGNSANAKTVINFEWKGGFNSVFPQNSAQIDKFISALNTTLNTMKRTLNYYHKLPKLIIIENKETDPAYFAATADRVQYLLQLAASIPIVHNQGLEVTNGGITQGPLALYVWYHYYYTVKDYTRASNFRNRALAYDAFTTYPTLTSENQQLLNIAITLINGTSSVRGYVDLPLDYVNIHWYLGPVGTFNSLYDELTTLQEQVDVLSFITGKPIIATEIGALYSSIGALPPPDLVRNIMSYFHTIMLFRYVIWRSGPITNGDAQPIALADKNGVLNDDGIQFRDYINNYFDNVFAASYWPVNGGLSDFVRDINITTHPKSVIMSGPTATLSVTIQDYSQVPSGQCIPCSRWRFLWYHIGISSASATSGVTQSIYTNTITVQTTGAYYAQVIDTAGSTPSKLALVWECSKIGNTLPATAVYINNEYTLFGQGGTIGGTSDTFEFLHLAAWSPFEMIANVVLGNASPTGSRAGIMLRSGDSTGTPFVMIAIGLDSKLYIQHRLATGGVAVTSTFNSIPATWLRMVWRNGGVVQLYYSTITGYNPAGPTSSSWTLFDTKPMPSLVNAMMGFAVAGSPPEQTWYASAKFMYVSVSNELL
eukprot:TRINITY_DN14954_c0_g1_i1.p1 TRINITY_DN14954_c0_g1~~TRINITY_DN14954_c0_g1_i1.p1  ORF type:complete len:717 (+),score=151.34 TRINITY_DN14954_c0_g1_i1:154-2304(+)